MDFPPSSLWSFSLAIYRRPGVAEACLGLQDRHGLDVNLLLAALFAATAGRAIDADGWRLVEGAVEAYHRAVVVPLRGARRALKPMEGAAAAAERTVAAQLRSAVKAAELDAEHLEQLMIEAALARLPGAADPEQGVPEQGVPEWGVPEWGVPEPGVPEQVDSGAGDSGAGGLAQANLLGYLHARRVAPGAADRAAIACLSGAIPHAG